MKITKVIATVATWILFISCGGVSKQAVNADGFGVIEEEIKDKFGNDAYFTDLKVLYIKDIGNTISTTVTEAPESLKMGQWDFAQNTWTQRSEIILEVPTGRKAKGFMFQLGEAISLTKLGGLVEKSIQQLKDEKGLENSTLSIASINFPDNGDVSEAKYVISLKPENGGTTFSFYYKLNGELIEMDY